MPTLKQFNLAIQALQELTPEIEDSIHFEKVIGVPSFHQELPTLFEVIRDIDFIPSSSILFGIATDGLPILLNLYDPEPGSILILGDSDSGKVAFLQTIAHAASILHDPKNIRFGVITSKTEIWDDYKRKPNCLGIFPVHSNVCSGFIDNLVNWMHSNQDDHQSILLLIDELEYSIPSTQKDQQDLYTLLIHGPEHRIWPIATLNANQYQNTGNWAEIFQTRIFGHISEPDIRHILNIPIEARVNTLAKGTHFTLPERNDWLRFWIPALKR